MDGLRSLDRRSVGVLGALVLAQALLFHDRYAVALAVVFGLGIGLWLRHWTAALWALATFFAALVIAVATGWLDDARPFAEPLLGGALTLLGGLIGGGVFQLLREERPVVVEERVVRERAPAARMVRSD